MKNKNFYYLVIILSLAAIVGIFSIKFLPGTLVGDESQYNRAALALINTHTYPIIDGILLPPALPFFLAICFKLFNQNYSIFYFVQFILLGGIGYAVFLIGHKFLSLSRKQSLVPAIIIIFWPYFIFYANSVLTEILFSFFLVYSVCHLIQAWNSAKLYNALLFGFFAGLASLTRPSNLLLPFWLFIIAFFYFFFKKKYIKKYKKIIILSLIIYILTITPWIIYASFKTKQFTPITSTAKKIISDDNKSYAYEWVNYKTPGYEPGAPITAEKIIKIKIKNIHRFWKSGAAGFQAQNIVNHFASAKYFILIYRIIYYLLLALFFGSLYFLKQKNITIIWLIILYYWTLHSTLHPYPRYTLPIIPLMIVVAFYSFYNLANIKLRSQNKNV